MTKGPRILKDQVFDDRGWFERMADRHNWAIYDQITGKVDWFGVVVFPLLLIALLALLAIVMFLAR